LVDVFSLINKDYELIGNPLLDGYIYYKIKSKNKILPINSLSFGEKHLLNFLIRMNFSEKNSYIIIDEPGLGLNEEKLIHFINKIMQLRDDLKFLFITHSEKLGQKMSYDKENKLY
jgi:energy-coupling factor transporter ATP-binding protein EcfA2